jgi:xylulose-5-phosphate/fructose-6-phosphate phosphoketolase
MVDARLRARNWTRLHGADLPEIADWMWPYGAGAQ